VIVDAGIALETESNHGAAYGVVNLLLAGSNARTGEMISNRISQLGSIVIPFVHYDYSQLYAKTLTKNFSATLDILADATLTPSFPEQSLLRLQQEASVTPYRQVSSGEHATIAAVKRLCGDGHVMSRFLHPLAEEVQAMSVDQLHAFHSAWYQPRRTTIIVTGNLDYKFVRTALMEIFGRWENGEIVQQPDVKRDAMDSSVVVISDTLTPNGLAYFRIGGVAFLRNEKDFAPQMLLNSILSDGAQSRLRQMLWGKHVLSPNFTTAIAFSRDCSYFMISGSASPNSTDSVLQLIQDMNIDIARNGITEEELETAKERILADETLIFATNRNLQSLLKEAAIYGLTLEELFSFNRRIRLASAQDIQRVAQQVLAPDHLQTVVLGSAEKIVPLVKTLGKQVQVTE
jgi:zinc protease